MTKSKPLPPLEELRKAFHYDPDTGILTHAYTKSGMAKEGCPAGTLCKDGYLGITHKYSRYRANRLAWLLGHDEDPGDFTVDHIDGDRLNNRLNNLRLATTLNNLSNRVAKGFYPSGKKYRAVITHNGVYQNLGTFETPEEASAAYKSAKRHMCGEFCPEEYK